MIGEVLQSGSVVRDGGRPDAGATESGTLAVRTDLHLRPIDASLLVYDERRQAGHLLNTPAAAVFELCDGTNTRNEIVAKVAADFGAPRDLVSSGVEESITMFDRCHLLASEDEAAEAHPRTQSVDEATAHWNGAATPNRPMAPTVGAYRSLGHSFAIRTDDPVLADHLRALWESLATEDHPDHEYSVVVAGATYAVFFDGVCRYIAPSPSAVTPFLIWHVNRSAADTPLPRHLILHASAVARDGYALLLPGDTGNGKTSLALTLRARGWTMLADDLVAVAHDGDTVVANLRPTPVRRTSHRMLTELEPRWPPSQQKFSPAVEWLIPHQRLDTNQACKLAAIVFPRFEDGAVTSLAPLDAPTLAAQMVSVVVNLDHDTDSNLDAVCSLAVRLGTSRAWNMTMSDGFDAPVRLIEEAFATATRLGGPIHPTGAAGLNSAP